MPQTLDYHTPNFEPKPKGPQSDWVRWSVRVCIFVIFGIAAFYFCIVLMWHNSFGRVITKDYNTQESAKEFADWILHGEVLAKKSDDGATYQILHESVISRTTGIRGFQHTSFSGTEVWIEVQVTSDLAAEFREKLPKSSRFEVKDIDFINYQRSKPGWWPKTWPADMRCYQNRPVSIFVSDSSSRVWLMVDW